jgi:repressor LexA
MSGTTIEQMPRDSLGRVAPTPRQRKLLRAIGSLTKRKGYPPTIRELSQAMGERGTNGIAQHLGLLRRKGWVSWEPWKARTLQVIGGVK